MISPSMDKWHTPIPYLFPHKGQSATLSKGEKKGHCKELGERCHPILIDLESHHVLQFTTQLYILAHYLGWLGNFLDKHDQWIVINKYILIFRFYYNKS